jgi:hypothetical protein
MEVQSNAARILYGELSETATVFDVLITSGPGKGTLKERSIAGRTYHYWQYRDLRGNVRQHYLGAATAESQARVRALVENRASLDEVRTNLKGLARAFVAAGGMANQVSHFKVIEALVYAGLFQKGAMLVGSHAFVALGNALGFSWSAAATATQDIDLARARGVVLAVNPQLRVEVPRILDALGMGFFLVPDLNRRRPSTSLQSNRARVKVDFLMPMRAGAKDTAPVFHSDLGIAAQPIRFMDYLVGGEPTRGFVIGAYALPVVLPSPGRFAIHKIVVSQCRTVSFAAKAEKDLRQAAAMLRALDAARPAEIEDALRAAAETRGMRLRVRAGRAALERIDREAASSIRELRG